MLRFSAVLVVAPMLAFAEPISTTVEAAKTQDPGRLEFTLYPVVPELNGKFTQHVGTMLQLTWHLRERFGLTLVGGGNWLNRENDFNAELVNSARVEAQAASSFLRTWTAMAGIEVAPFSGTLTLLASQLAHFSVVVDAGAGLGRTRRQLKPAGSTPATYEDTGLTFMAEIGAGVRFVIGEHVAVRLELRDVVYTARDDGCLGVGSQVPPLLPIPGNGTARCPVLPLALGRLRPSSVVINSLGVWVGVSVLP
jgi:outer membrane beta-barrel protein